jgi:YfiH family protein
MIYPEIFDGLALGFFTDREVGIEVETITHKSVYFPVQKHTDIVNFVEEDLRSCTADAVITKRKDILLGVKVADCVPILLLDRVKGIAAAVHAGWRGTAKGILKNTITAIVDKYGARPGDLLVAMGPSIKRCCYEVSDDVIQAITDKTGVGDYHGKAHLDLQGANRAQALSAGIRTEHVYLVEECTCCSDGKYNSYRRDKGSQGRQGGFIGIIEK